MDAELGIDDISKELETPVTLLSGIDKEIVPELFVADEDEPVAPLAPLVKLIV